MKLAVVFDLILAGSVSLLNGQLDSSVIHGDGTTTAAARKAAIISDSTDTNISERCNTSSRLLRSRMSLGNRNCNVIAPFVSAPGNRNESPLLKAALPQVTRIAKQVGLDLSETIVSLDGVYDSRANRKAIFNRGMVPNIPENRRGRKTPKRGRKSTFDPAIFQERFYTIERVFAWEDKFRRLLIRFERISRLHYALKTLAYTMINLRHFCQS